MVDAGANTLTEVKRDSKAKIVAFFRVPKGSQSDAVPTCIARGPGGALSVGELLGGFYAQGHARIWRVVPGHAPGGAGHSPGRLGFCCRPKLVDNLDAVGCCPVDGSLGELSSATSASEEARDHHGQALTIAQEIGAHPEEARALAGIGMSLLPRSPAEAAAHLRKALAIYRRIGSPDAQPVQDTLDEHGL